MAITCCCGISRKLSHSNHREDLEQNYVHELATVISISEVESTIARVVSRLFRKAESTRIHWTIRNEIDRLPFNSNHVYSTEFEKLGRLILSSKQMEKPNYAELFKDRQQSNYGIFLPIVDRTGSAFKAYLQFYCDQWDGRRTKSLDLLEKQIYTMFQRLDRMHCIAPSVTDGQCNDSSHGNINSNLKSSILSLCGDLNDKDPWMLQMKIINFLKMSLGAEGGFILLLSNDDMEFECQVIDNEVMNPELRCKVEGSLLEHVVNSRTEQTFSSDEIQSRTTEFQSLREACQYEWRNVLSVPIINQFNDSIMAVACFVNKGDGDDHFDEVDVDTIRLVFHYTSAVLTSSIAYRVEMRMKTQTEIMLQVAMNIFRKLDNLTVLLKEIMTEAKKLTNAERCSVFLLEEETDELVAKVFDGLETVSENSDTTVFVTPDGLEIEHPKEIRISAKQGIAGKVASTGEILNILDAYSSPLFYRGVDDATGYRTRNILCFPIKDENEKVVGVAQLCNKVNGPHFTTYDVELARAFSVYCCISIVHSLMYKNVQDAQHRNKLANELMTYHMQISEENFHWLSTCKIPDVKVFLPDFTNFESIPRRIQERESIMAVLGMFHDLRLMHRWRISRSVLARFILMVKRGYRDPPYHNWTHAFSVAHFAFLCAKNLNLQDQLTDLEIFAFFVASLCHDIDHRGTNNSFQVTSNSVLAALYSSEGSVLERHHFSQTICILNSDGCNIFENLSRQEYQAALDLIRDIILATDLAHHFRVMPQQRQMVEVGYSRSNVEHHKLLLFLLMTCADLSDQIKCWDNTRNVAQLIYEEFFSQGDLERAIGQKPCEQMDRERACIPSLQLSFLDGVVTPCFQTFTILYNEHGKTMVRNININWSNWEKLNNDIQAGKIAPNIFQIFQKDMSPLHTTILDRDV